MTDADERQAEALERIADELERQNAVLTEVARAQHLTAVAGSDFADPDEKPTSAPNTRSLLTMIRDNESERERAEDDRLMTDGGIREDLPDRCPHCGYDATEDDHEFRSGGGWEHDHSVSDGVWKERFLCPSCGHVVATDEKRPMADGGGHEETIKNWLVINWRKGTTRTRKSKPDPSSIGTNELATSLTLNVTIPDVDMPDLVADVEVPQPRVDAAELSDLDAEDSPDWMDVADAVVDEHPDADPFDEVDRLVVSVLEDAPGRPDVDEVKRYLQTQLRQYEGGAGQ